MFLQPYAGLILWCLFVKIGDFFLTLLSFGFFKTRYKEGAEYISCSTVFMFLQYHVHIWCTAL